MEHLFLSIFDFYAKRPRWLFITFLSIVSFCAILASRIEIKENVTDIFPDDQKTSGITNFFQARTFEKLIFVVSYNDSSNLHNPDRLINFADSLISTIQLETGSLIESTNYKIDDEGSVQFLDVAINHLPVFLNDDDYIILDSLLEPNSLKQRIRENYRQMLSPAGIFTKHIYTKDIIGISNLALHKFQQLQYDDNFVLYDNCLFTKDLKNLVFFLTPQYPSSDTGHNIKLIASLDNIIESFREKLPNTQTTYFGGPVVAVGNARQIRSDTNLTVSIMVVILIAFTFWFFKKRRAPFVILIPVAFGGMFALACISVLQGSISVLALAAGSIILGIAVNYSLHFIVHIQHVKSSRETVKDLASPMTLGSATTVLAFLGLQFANAGVLRDIGLFAAFSLIGAAICTLIFLPHFFKNYLFQANEHAQKKLGMFLAYDPSKRKWIVLAIILLTPLFLYFAGDVTFNSDMNKLNFMSDKLQSAQNKLNEINKFSLQSTYIVVKGENAQQALRENEQVTSILHQAKKDGLIEKYLSPSTLLLSDSIQLHRLNKWNSYWTIERKNSILSTIKEVGDSLRFSPAVYDLFLEFTSNNKKPITDSLTTQIRNTFFEANIIFDSANVMVANAVMIKPEWKDEFYKSLNSLTSSTVIDRQLLVSNFIQKVNDDFTFIVMFTSVLVFVALLLAYGRIELALITFIPMFVTWIWILGIMALLNIEFNIVNVMISTFIFGLGDDYSIFTMDGLQQQYKTGRKNLSSIRISVLISACTTITGLGVLAFAQHPALKSIAAISITGIACVFIMSQTLEPFLFNALIASRAKRGLMPITFWGLIKTIIAYTYFALGSFMLSLLGLLLLKLIPLQISALRSLYHKMLCFFSSTLVYMMANLKKRVIGHENVFKEPAIIICNHNSFLDILVTTMLSPRVILLTNKWVWNSPVFGAVVRLGEYYPVAEGADSAVDKLRKKVKEGFSIVIFPEGTRSPDGQIKRFHKGAFYLAEKLKLPIRPLLIHGTRDTIQKGDYYLNDATMTLKFLPPIQPDNTEFGTTYSERTKSISRYFKREYQQLSLEVEVPDYFYYKLMRNYYYKGPVLEWYLRIKLRLENNYSQFHRLIPLNAAILDLGCGYGFMSYMLHFTSSNRAITGVDYDQEKIDTANHAFLKNEKLSFYCDDITNFSVSGYDVIILSDVLHYLTPEQQNSLLDKCFSGINPGGKVIIREGDAGIKERHQRTKITEFLSTKLFKFNKSVRKLSFIHADLVKQKASNHNLEVQIIHDSKFTSNVIFVVK